MGHSPASSPVARDHFFGGRYFPSFPSRTSRLDATRRHMTPICGLNLLLVLSLAPRGFSPGFRFSPLLKNQHFQIPIRSGTHEHVSTSSYELLSAPWVKKLQKLQFNVGKACGIRGQPTGDGTHKIVLFLQVTYFSEEPCKFAVM